MTVVEAVAVIRENRQLWARPVSWKGSASAVYAHAGSLWSVTANGESRQYAACVRDIIEHWEVLKPEKVLSELA